VKVFIKGHGSVELTNKHYVAAGGQASVYVKDRIAYKIYTDPKNAIPEAKFQALAPITDADVIKPTNLILEGTTPIGYTMTAVEDSYSLCQLFTKTFRDRNNVTNDNIIHVVDELRKHVANIHAAGIVVVDLNELNILVGKALKQVFMIDVDSYQTPGFPATVLMPSVRDHSVKSNQFTALSDWYSFAVLSFQLFIGVHPYKGSHAPTESIAKDQRMGHRMKHNISAFLPEVSLPKCCYPLSAIPPHFSAWMKAVLQEGKRLAPPDVTGVPVIVVQPTPVAPLVTSGNVVIKEIMDLDAWSLVSYAESGGRTIALATNGKHRRIIVDGRVIAETPAPPAGSITTLVGFTPRMNNPISLSLKKDGTVNFFDEGRKSFEQAPFTAQQISKAGDRFYIKNGTRVCELEFVESTTAATSVNASRQVADVMEQASQLYEGVAIQNMIGSVFVSVFPKSKFGYQVKMPQLDGYKIKDAKFEGGVLMVVGAKGGKYDRLVFRFDPDYQTYDMRVVSDVPAATEVNFVTLASGVCICLNEEEELEAFSAKKDAAGMKVVSDSALGGDVHLMHVQGKAGFERAGKIYGVSLK
jgi:hypothetical protein